jgi:hypothetical protein
MCQHISNIIYIQYESHIADCKYCHVATVVAGPVATVVAGPDLPATGAFTSRPNCHFQWHEGSHVETHNMLVLRKETRKIQSKPGLYLFFQGNVEICSYVKQINHTSYKILEYSTLDRFRIFQE